jgi:hypothetical protein
MKNEARMRSGDRPEATHAWTHSVQIVQADNPLDHRREIRREGRLAERGEVGCSLVARAMQAHPEAPPDGIGRSNGVEDETIGEPIGDRESASLQIGGDRFFLGRARRESIVEVTLRKE